MFTACRRRTTGRTGLFPGVPGISGLPGNGRDRHDRRDGDERSATGVHSLATFSGKARFFWFIANHTPPANGPLYVTLGGLRFSTWRSRPTSRSRSMWRPFTSRRQKSTI